MCSCTSTRTCATHARQLRITCCGDSIFIGPRETRLERAERRYHEALNVSGSTARTLDAAETYIHELKMALHGSVAA